MEQRTDEWLAARAGVITASRVAGLMAKGRGGKPSTTRDNLIATLAIERLTGACEPTYQNDAMRRGIELEDEARNAYIMATGRMVKEEAFILHPKIKNVGCSPDGLIGKDGMLEIKCPNAMAKHFKALTEGAHVTEYKWQLHHQLFVTGREWVDIVSYDPRYPNKIQLAIETVEKDNALQEELAEAIAAANKEIDERVNELKELENAARK